MAAQTWRAAIRSHLRKSPALWLDYEVFWDTYGFALRDGNGEEHHFGFPEHVEGGVVFTFIASYSDEGRDATWPGGVHDKLSERGYELAEDTRGPDLSPMVEVALEELAEFATRKGFAFDEERQAAVRTFGALRLAGERYEPEEVYVWGATNGFKPKDADGLQEYARRAVEGGGTRTVGGRAIRVDSAQADRMIEHWRSQVQKRESGGFS